MSFSNAVKAVGEIPLLGTQAVKKGYSESLSKQLAPQVAAGLRRLGFENVKPLEGGPGEKEFYGGLGSKKVDVSYADERHGLLLAVSIKSICFRDSKSQKYSKNLKNRFGDICTESITLHMRFPYAVVGVLFAFPEDADSDSRKKGKLSTFKRAAKLMATLGGRQEYTDPGEKVENVTMMLFSPVTATNVNPSVRLFDAKTMQELTEEEYFNRLREIYNFRNPHKPIGEQLFDDDDEETEVGPE